jgi:hypothetical protein
MGGYDVSQICLNGHVITNYFESQPFRAQDHCDKCGTATITRCSKCQNPIRGGQLGTSGFPRIKLPAPCFCIYCGNPFPWTESKLIAAHELANEVEDLTEEDRNILQTSIDDLVKDTPSSNLSAIRFKKVMQKVGPAVASMFREILVDVLSETIKKSLFP